MSQKENQIEYFNGEFLHPSLDIKDNLLIYGFRFIAKDLKDKTIFVVADSEKIMLCHEENFTLNDKRYYIENKGKLLARIEERWSLKELIRFVNEYNTAKTESPTLKGLLEKDKELLKKYVELETEEDYLLLASWIIGTYVYPIFSAFPFLHIKAPKESGKTQCLNLKKQTCFNAIKAKPSLAALGDTVNSLRGTCLLDQSDSLKHRNNEELIEILTDSYKKEGGKRRIRMPQKQGGWKTIEQETYSPKTFASIGELPEDLADRCVTIPLIRTEKVFPEPSEENENWRDVRGYHYKVALTNFPTIKSTYEILKNACRIKSTIIGRDLELWLPIETILKHCLDDEALMRVRKRYEQLHGYTKYEPNELEKEIIRNISEAFNNRKDNKIILRPSEIREGLNEIIWEDKSLGNHQKEIRIGHMVKKFNLSSEKKNTSKGVAYIFEQEKVLKIKNLYCKTEENTPHSSL